MNAAIDYELIEHSVLVRSNAQAPYSHYHVGSAVRSRANLIYRGCNVERCSYTQTTHAEQNAIDSMIAHEGPTKIQAVAVVAAPANVTMHPGALQKYTVVSLPPAGGCCGHCLQIIWENCFGDPAVPIYFVDTNATIHFTTIGTLLPYPFGPLDLKIDYEKQVIIP